MFAAELSAVERQHGQLWLPVGTLGSSSHCSKVIDANRQFTEDTGREVVEMDRGVYYIRRGTILPAVIRACMGKKKTKRRGCIREQMLLHYIPTTQARVLCRGSTAVRGISEGSKLHRPSRNYCPTSLSSSVFALMGPGYRRQPV